jgi:putative ABC transport system substrate-binding protein
VAPPLSLWPRLIPIVFTTGGDPVKLGLVASHNRPGGNVTGVSWMNNTTAPKRLELLRALLPGAATIGLLRNPANPNAAAETLDVQTAASALGQQIEVENAGNEREIDAAFARFVRGRVDALFVAADPLFTDRRDQVNMLAARHAIPASYVSRINVVAGGLMSYGADYTDAYRQMGLYTTRILKGEKPADLPVMQSVKFEFVINLRIAKALRLTVPDKVLALADEVIE